MSNPEQNPNPQRTFAGMPVNWDAENWYKGMWNVDDHRLFPPKRGGIGRTINFRERLRRLRLIGLMQTRAADRGAQRSAALDSLADCSAQSSANECAIAPTLERHSPACTSPVS